MKVISRITALVPIIFLSACTQAKFFVVNAPTWFNDVKIRHDVAYGDDPAQKLDIYFPPGAEPRESRPVIVFFYGGRWTTGARGDYRFVGSALAKKGFIAIIPDTRKYPAVRFPAFVQDGAKAVAWAVKNAGVYGADPARIFVAGHSSGAHIGALVATDPGYLGKEGLERGVIRRFAGLAGPYAFTPDAPDLVDMFGPREKYPAMQIPTFIDGHQPPMLLLYGDADKEVGRFNLEKLQAAIRKKGGLVETKIYHDVDHVDIISSLSWVGGPPVLQDIVDFFRPRKEQ